MAVACCVSRRHAFIAQASPLPHSAPEMQHVVHRLGQRVALLDLHTRHGTCLQFTWVLPAPAAAGQRKSLQALHCTVARCRHACFQDPSEQPTHANQALSAHIGPTPAAAQNLCGSWRAASNVRARRFCSMGSDGSVETSRRVIPGQLRMKRFTPLDAARPLQAGLRAAVSV